MRSKADTNTFGVRHFGHFSPGTYPSNSKRNQKKKKKNLLKYDLEVPVVHIKLIQQKIQMLNKPCFS